MTNEEYLSYFEDSYKNKLIIKNDKGIQVVDRYSGFYAIFSALLEKNKRNFTIIETGCQRELDNWLDGQSSSLYFEFVTIFGGKLISIDNSFRNLSLCTEILKKRFPDSEAQFVPCLGNSLIELEKQNEPTDLLYLDSLDIDEKNPQMSMVHHLKELVSARNIIKNSPDLIVAIDDNAQLVGKGLYLYEWARDTKKTILYRGYQIAFRL